MKLRAYNEMVLGIQIAFLAKIITYGELQKIRVRLEKYRKEHVLT